VGASKKKGVEPVEKTATALVNRPAWIDLGTSDAPAAREFYSKLFGWEMDVSADPQYGGYATAKLGEGSVCGIAPKMSDQAPTAWSLYIGTDDSDALARDVAEAGGTVIMAPFDVGDQGKMAVFQDPSGAFISSWQPTQMSSFVVGAPNAYGWAELNARGVDKALPFYQTVFGWATRTSPMGEGQPPYTEFLLAGQTVAGAWEMSPMVPAEVPSYWQVYFNVDDVDAAFEKALGLGAREMLAPRDFPGGRFAIMMDPQGASFALLKYRPPA
jgi:predicted enzyme related to lactoylglutathione lyase